MNNPNIQFMRNEDSYFSNPINVQNVIENMNYDAVLINYKTKNYDRDIKKISSLKTKLIRKLFYKRCINDDCFDKFRINNLKISDEYISYAELQKLNSEFDVFICGSDQIWSPISFDEKFYLNFADNNKIISYAPSFGINKIEDDYIKNKIKNLILRFNFISVRERQGEKIIKDLTGQEQQFVLDPTLLIDCSEWDKIVSNVNINVEKDKYILCYFLGKSNKYYKDIVKYAKKNNLKIINVPVFKNKLLSKYNIDNVGPLEFVKLIKNAKCIFTDSYHGTIFSINFNRPFITYKRFKDNSKKSENSRLESIFELLDIKNHFVEKFNSISNIDYDKVNKLLKKYRKQSISFLKNSIEKVNEIDLEKNNYTITNYCTGCGACKNICPKKAIEVKEDSLGFQKSFIDPKKCINCGLCRKICPIRNLNCNEIKNMKNLYSFKSNEKDVLLTSSSGGFSYMLSLYLNNDYYVCGCYYDKTEKSAKHILIEPKSSNQLSKIQGSKYIQSKTADIFEQILNLSNESKVVFFGTPCQVAGLDSLLK